jgi:amino acid transporter
MVQDIILPLISIIIGLIYLKWMYKRNDNSFFNQKDDSFSKVQTLKGWFVGLGLIIVGVLFLFKGISQYI